MLPTTIKIHLISTLSNGMSSNKFNLTAERFADKNAAY